MAMETGEVSVTAVARCARGWRLADASSDAVYERSENDLRDGFCVALELWAWRLFDMTAFDSAEDERDGED